MAQIFPKWTQRIAPTALVASLIGAPLFVALVWYYASPEYTDVGYRPTQPIPYSHKQHVGQLGIDCRYCHVGVQQGAVATIPPTQVCMNCHLTIAKDRPTIALIRRSMAENRPIEWIRVHKTPDYAYFRHDAHLAAGVGCSTCHGRIDRMDVIKQQEPLSMRWCLDCHRNPETFLRPVDRLFDMTWKPASDAAQRGAEIVAQRGLEPPTDCTGCHR